MLDCSVALEPGPLPDRPILELQRIGIRRFTGALTKDRLPRAHLPHAAPGDDAEVPSENRTVQELRLVRKVHCQVGEVYVLATPVHVVERAHLTFSRHVLALEHPPAVRRDVKPLLAGDDDSIVPSRENSARPRRKTMVCSGPLHSRRWQRVDVERPIRTFPGKNKDVELRTAAAIHELGKRRVPGSPDLLSHACPPGPQASCIGPPGVVWVASTLHATHSAISVRRPLAHAHAASHPASPRPTARRSSSRTSTSPSRRAAATASPARTAPASRRS